MVVNIDVLNLDISSFKKVVEYINKNNKLIVGTGSESAFETLKEHWKKKENGFVPEDSAELVMIIKKELKNFIQFRELQAELKKFASLCEIYYTKDEDTFEAFQAVMQNKTPLDGNIIMRLYEKTFGSLLNTAEYEEIHKKTNGNTLYQLFGFESDSHIYTRINLKTKLDKEEFGKDAFLSRNGKWEDLKLFANVLKDDPSKEKYDAYYRFLMCKKILKDVYRQNKSLVSYKYLEVVSKLEKYKICNNSEEAKIVIGSFCDEIGLTWKFTTPEKVKEDEDRIRGLRIRIEEKVNQLKTRQKEFESSLSGIGNEIDTLQKDVDSEINKMSSVIKTLKSSSEAIYEEEDKLKVLEQQIADLQKLKQKIKEVESFRDETQKNIAKEVKNADNKQEEITFDNVQAILNEVTAKEGEINKLFNEFIGKYNNEIIKVVQEGFRNAKSKFYNTEREINAERERVKKKISEARTNLKKYTKPITKRFVWIQILLLITFVVIYIPLFTDKKLEFVFFCLNAVGFIGYVIYVSWQFNKYNQVVETINESPNKKEEYRSPAKLIGNIIWACIFFVLVQFCFLVYKYIDFSTGTFSFPSLSMMIIIIFVAIFLISRNKNKNKL